jgi:hypothetical protein
VAECPLTSLTSQTVASGVAVTPRIPGIQSKQRMGTMYMAHRTTIPRFNNQ